MLRVAVVDECPIALRGLAAIFADQADMQVVAAVPSPAHLPREEDGRVMADVVLCDFDRPQCKVTSEANVRSLSASADLLVMSDSWEAWEAEDVLVFMLRTGARGFIPKNATEGTYIKAVRQVAAGGVYVPSRSDQLKEMSGADTEAAPVPSLSPREREALVWIAGGYTHQQAAVRMGVSKATVDTLVARIRAKLGVGNKAELTLAALRYLRSGTD
ncbi:response regulator transcription factor [Streptomyces sp. BK340]|uniref:response regulator transcription factor n=1 Tax=Streptomyces sp. BK340 TaxID=2572903 RepID=UPI001644416C|nr:response regulator transcription factor [Streptomyces sp. BK340]